jgi:sulfur carrier protein
MTIQLNGDSRHFPESELTVTQVLDAIGLAGKPVVVELDREPVLPANLPSTMVTDGSVLEIVTIAAGG